MLIEHPELAPMLVVILTAGAARHPIRLAGSTAASLRRTISALWKEPADTPSAFRSGVCICLRPVVCRYRV